MGAIVVVRILRPASFSFILPVVFSCLPFLQALSRLFCGSLARVLACPCLVCLLRFLLLPMLCAFCVMFILHRSLLCCGVEGFSFVCFLRGRCMPRLSIFCAIRIAWHLFAIASFVFKRASPSFPFFEDQLTDHSWSPPGGEEN